MSLLTDLISYWKLDEASGARVDVHGGYDLTDHNTVGSGTGLVYGTAGDFEQDNAEWLDVADNPDLSGGDVDLTIGLWVKPESLANNSGWAGKGDSGGFEWLLETQAATKRFRFRAATGTGEAGVHIATDNEFGGSDVNTSTWYLVLGYHDATNDKIGIATSNNNFTRYETAHTGGVWDSTGPFAIGRWSAYFPSYSDGLIGPVMFWKRLLTDQEMTDLYNGGAGLTYAAFSGGGGGTPWHYYSQMRRQFRKEQQQRERLIERARHDILNKAA